MSEINNQQLSIVRSEDSRVYRLEEDGNIFESNSYNKVNLKEKNIILSNSYYHIEDIGNDHYVFCDAVTEKFLQYEKFFYDLKLPFKFGIFVLQRDEKGNIIPKAEEIIVPALYDRISNSNSNTVIVYGNNNHLTYIDIDPESINYGKQLVPVILEHATPFDSEYEGFAECSVEGIVGYLPRNCTPKDELSPLDLLTEEQVKCIAKCVNNDIFDSALDKFTNLTGGQKTLGLTKKLEKENYI